MFLDCLESHGSDVSAPPIIDDSLFVFLHFLVLFLIVNIDLLQLQFLSLVDCLLLGFFFLEGRLLFLFLFEVWRRKVVQDFLEFVHFFQK